MPLWNAFRVSSGSDMISTRYMEVVSTAGEPVSIVRTGDTSGMIKAPQPRHCLDLYLLPLYSNIPSSAEAVM